MPFPSPVPTFHDSVYDAINPKNLSAAGKTVLITGGGQGLGIAFAKAFSIAGAANIVLFGRKLNTLNETKSIVEGLSGNKSKVHTYAVDITDKTTVDKTFAEVASNIGLIDVYVANAGYLATMGPIATVDVAELQTSVNINMIGTLITIQAFLKHKAANATIIGLNTGASHIYYFGPMALYSATKAGDARLFDAVATENTDVRVFNIHPGVIATDMAAKAGMDAAAKDTPDLPASFAVWLTQPEAEFLRGRFVWANWDVTELQSIKEEITSQDMFKFELGGWPFKHQVSTAWAP